MKPKTVGREMGASPLQDESVRQSRAEYSKPSTQNGLVVGTRLLTLDGEMPVEFLSSGDRIITRDAGLSILRDIRVIDADCEMVRVRAGSLGHTRPDSDMILPATQRVLVRDWRAQALFDMKAALVPVKRLADGAFVTLEARRRVRLIQLCFDAPHILYADGLEVESGGVVVSG